MPLVNFRHPAGNRFSCLSRKVREMAELGLPLVEGKRKIEAQAGSGTQ
jgi:hypothetical protein